MNTVLVTGAAGMIGSNLCARLLSLGFRVIGIDNLWRGSLKNLQYTCGKNFKNLEFYECDLAATGEWTQLLNGVDCVIHLADIVAGIGYVMNNEAGIFNQNLLINSTISNAVRDSKIKRYIYIGTACSFPHELQYGTDAPPLKESQQFPANPESAYGWSKLMGELDARYISLSGDIDSVVLVFHNVYGSPCDYKSDRSQVIPSLAYKALIKNNTNSLEVWGDGSQGRAFVHVDDAVDALVSALDKGENQGPIQIGPDFCSSVREVANLIKDIANPSLSLVFDESKPTGDRGRCANYSKAKKTLNWKPRVSLESGLSNLIDWIESVETLG
jgi:GDP-D-mannose 3', 5'-epimerase